MRLTKKKNNEYIANTEIKTKSQQFAWLRQLGFKLGKLEDIEEELGIDLITLFKVINEGAYFKRFVKGKVIAIEHHYIWFDLLRQIRYKDKDEGEVYISLNGAYCNEHEYKLKDYGKTWALTKEELK